jgi:enoyl-CoA hydratase/carnithine racemase
MNELQFGSRIRHILNQGTQLQPRIADRLAKARQLALSRQRAEAASVLRWADNVVGGDGSEAPAWQAWARVLVPGAALIVAVAGIYSWQEKQRLAEIVEIDAQLLTDDLPIDAYLDRGFQNWLKTRTAAE